MSKEEILAAKKVDRNELSQSDELSDKEFEKVTGGENRMNSFDGLLPRT